MSESALLKINELSSFYGDFQALFHLDIEVAENETIAIIGANGAGKSTLLKSIMGLIKNSSKSIAFAGNHVGDLPANKVATLGIALVPEGRRLFSSLSVEENLIIGGQMNRPGYWNLETVYALFPDLKTHAQKPADELSGGQRQMVAIGRGLMSNPKLLLIDEASLGLAPVIVKDIYNSLDQIKSQGTSVLIVEQDITQAMAVSDRVYCLKEGQVSLSGKPGELEKQDIIDAYFGV